MEMEEFAANLNVAGLLTFTSQPRGLVNFISDIRHVKSKDDERKRIDKELGNIRLKFSMGSTLTSYQRKSMYGRCVTFTCWDMILILVTQGIYIHYWISKISR